MRVIGIGALFFGLASERRAQNNPVLSPNVAVAA